MKKVLALTVALGFFGATIFSIAEDAKDGKAIFIANKCGTCHSVKSLDMKSGSAAEKNDLSTVGDRVKAAELVTYLKKETKLKDKLHVKKVDISEADMTILTKWLGGLKAAK